MANRWTPVSPKYSPPPNLDPKCNFSHRKLKRPGGVCPLLNPRRSTGSDPEHEQLRPRRHPSPCCAREHQHASAGLLGQASIQCPPPSWRPEMARLDKHYLKSAPLPQLFPPFNDNSTHLEVAKSVFYFPNPDVILNADNLLKDARNENKNIGSICSQVYLSMLHEVLFDFHFCPLFQQAPQCNDVEFFFWIFYQILHQMYQFSDIVENSQVKHNIEDI